MNYKLVFAGTIISAAITGQLNAQQSTEPAKTSDKKFPTTLQPVNPVKYYGPRKEKKKKSKKSVTYNAQNDYYNRVEKTWREREKNERTYQRGEGSDIMKPPYFGHKKPPKVRSIEKRKYCKVCGIRH
ncbi:MAG: hypothetical protein HOP08_07545 [Cyclobacteriaceae bacterium]|nr:hypothetical protein [Cyclobacteriaceae bacterium]